MWTCGRGIKSIPEPSEIDEALVVYRFFTASGGALFFISVRYFGISDDDFFHMYRTVACFLGLLIQRPFGGTHPMPRSQDLPCHGIITMLAFTTDILPVLIFLSFTPSRSSSPQPSSSPSPPVLVFLYSLLPISLLFTHIPFLPWTRIPFHSSTLILPRLPCGDHPRHPPPTA